MADRRVEQRHLVERRVLPDRRRGWDRRIAERRLEAVVVRTERRVRATRVGERRTPLPRRSWLDRRGSGITWSEPTLT